MTNHAREILKHLDEIPIEALGLSDEVREAVVIFKVKTIGHWLDEYDYLLTDSRIFDDDNFIPDDLYFMMHGEILLKLKEREDWPLIIQYLRPDLNRN